MGPVVGTAYSVLADWLSSSPRTDGGLHRDDPSQPLHHTRYVAASGCLVDSALATLCCSRISVKVELFESAHILLVLVLVKPLVYI